MALIELSRTQGEYGFTATDTNNQQLRMDIPVEKGGTGNGFRPMQVLLAGLGGCSAVDVVSILQKQRQEITDFSIHIDGEREPGKEPSLWQDVTVVFDLTGNIDETKAYRAAELSMNKYCSVAETLRRAGGDLKWQVNVNGKPVTV
ncbi:OsmC family protein [Filimonas effusa]|uniref:OsmC family peroxiredoxin n=1 Tax=Filimonas effusa TaxID=2508721 RepID=A0A4Q1D5S9_9BACT|nr:OsmC family protein [Filimonas effusa]RXK83021.1 OsmC family peroxiredoxin [Filimonas effusa]